MSDLFRKELTLSSSLLSYFFIAFGLMFFLPGYPVLCGAFFVTLGILQSFIYATEANDIVFSVLLPVSKKDVVRAKFMFVCFIELCAFLVMTASAVVRMTVLSGAKAYAENVMMNANLFALGCALVVFGLFNIIFVCGFFGGKRRYTTNFWLYSLAAFLLIAASETVHHIPVSAGTDLSFADSPVLQTVLLIAGIALYVLLTAAAFARACKNFDRLDL